MKEIIAKAKKILIVTDQRADFDKLCASIALAKSLNSSSREVSLSIPDNKYVQRVLSIFPTKDIKLMQKNEPDNFILSLAKDDAVVKNVKWKEENGKINIFITTEKGKLKETQISVKPNYALYDLIITIGITDLKDIGEFYLSNQKIFIRNRIVQIGALQSKIGTHRFTEESMSMSELVYKFLEFIEMKSDGGIYTDLMAGILWKIDGFNRIDDAEIIESLSQITNLGGNFKKASEKAFKNLNLQDTRLIQEILKNIEPADGEVVYSLVKASNKKSLLPRQIISSCVPILDRLSKFKVAIVLFEEQGSVFGLISSKDSMISAVDIAEGFNPAGDHFYATFTSDKDIELVKNTLSSYFEKKIKKEEGGGEESQIKGKPEQVKKDLNIQTAEPLKPAIKPPSASKIQQEEASPAIVQPLGGGFTPPPPINPLPPVSKEE